ncbi:MAG TPA: hypothetical protein VNC50_09270 [Planctomycetia bacterium]|nr:hypothetical protein [Planctomycetia bacterium]
MTRRNIAIAIVAMIALTAMMVRYYSAAMPLSIRGKSSEYFGRQIGGESAFRSAISKAADVLDYKVGSSPEFRSPLAIPIALSLPERLESAVVTLRDRSQLRLTADSEQVLSCMAKQAGEVVFITAEAPVSSVEPICQAYDLRGALMASFSDGDLTTRDRICASPDAGFFLVRSGDVLEKRSLKDCSMIDRIGMLPDDIRAIALSKNGESLYILTESGSFRTNATYVFDLTEKADPATRGRKN